MSAESNMVMPCSRQMSTMRVAPAASVEPHPASPPLPPKVPVPKLNSGTKKPERPSWRCSMAKSFPKWRFGKNGRPRPGFNRVRGAGIFGRLGQAAEDQHLRMVEDVVGGRDHAGRVARHLHRCRLLSFLLAVVRGRDVAE